MREWHGVKVATVIDGKVTMDLVESVVGDGPGATVVLLFGGIVPLNSCIILE